MHYFTYYNEGTQVLNTMNILESLYGRADTPKERLPYSPNYRSKRTYFVETLPHAPTNATHDGAMVRLSVACQEFLTRMGGDTSQCYTTFTIPKTNGGHRIINAPEGEIRELHDRLVDILRDGYRILEHNNAFAYVRGRCTKDALIRHKNADARWFLKLDLKNFFPSTTKTFLINQLSKLQPLRNISAEVWDPIIEVCLLNGGLPQGSTASPLLSNLMMIPFDYKLNKALFQFEKSTYCITRYADDILISNQYDFNWRKVQAEVAKVLKEVEAPFKINTSKTRYASSAGRNWNLGLMFNNRGQITVGHKRKKRIKNMMFYLFRDNAEQTTWSLEDCQHAIGELAYLQQVEPDALIDHIRKLEVRYNVTWTRLRKRIVSPR